MRSPGLRTPVKVMSTDEMADRIKELESRLKKAIEIIDDYAYAAGNWDDPEISYKELHTWKEDLRGGEE